jgi:hypothetical protein
MEEAETGGGDRVSEGSCVNVTETFSTLFPVTKRGEREERSRDRVKERGWGGAWRCRIPTTLALSLEIVLIDDLASS